MSVLEKSLDPLIAKKLRISPEDVTLEVVQKWRKKHIYPNPKYDFTTEYGGWSPLGLTTLSPREIEDVSREADEFIARFAEK